MEICKLAVGGDGASRYMWSSKVAQQVLLEPTLDRGICSIAWDARPGHVMYNEEPVVMCVTGTNEGHICKHCYCKIVGKAKSREDFPRITFCSTECLASASDNLTFCGPFLTELQKLKMSSQWENVTHMLTIAVYYVYSITAAATAAELTRALSVMHLESHPQLPSDELHEPAQWLTNMLCESLSTELFELLSSRGLSLRPQNHRGSTESTRDSTIYRLLRIIKYNAQPLNIYGVPKVQLLALLPSVARINHSCRPNCTLVYRIDRRAPASDEEAVHCSLAVSVLPLRAIAAGEELTMSYLQPLCASRQMRRTLLQQGFAFNCRCERCQAEERTQHADTVRDPQLESELQRVMADASRGQVQPLAVLRALMDRIENTLTITAAGQGGSAALSLVHDASALVLEQAKAASKQLGPGNHTVVDYQWLVVRAQSALSMCWKGIGCATCVQRMELTVQAAQIFVSMRLGRTASPPSTRSGGEDSGAQKLLDTIRTDLQDALEVLRTIYLPSSTSSVSGDGSHTSASAGTGNGALSSAEYVEKLYHLGMRCLEQLS